MRKQMKIAAVVSAAALLALGASITSFAAVKGTWKYVDGEWYCYDKNGDVYENEFCLSNGKEFYVGDNGTMVTSSWVEDDGDYYFVNSAGQKVVNDWRLATPYDDDSEDEQWYYFQSTGKRAENKKLIIKGKTYFFDTDGKMLTGWVQNIGDDYEAGESDINADTAGKTFYCDETGARIGSDWIKTIAPEIDEDDADTDDENWYYLKSSGTVAKGKVSNIKGQTYFFGEDGKMLTGWVAKTDSNYKQIWESDDDTDGIYPDKLGDPGLSSADVYFCGEDGDSGYMRKNKWLKLWNNKQFGMEDDDEDKYWFFAEKSGKIYIPSVNSTENATKVKTIEKYKFLDGEETEFEEIFSLKKDDNDQTTFKALEKKLNGKTYLFDENGQMVTGFVKVDDGTEAGLMYYYGASDDGEMEDGSATIADDSGETYKFYFAPSTDADESYFDGVGITGAKNGKLYQNGLLVKARNDKYEWIEDIEIQIPVRGEDNKITEFTTQKYKFIVNQSGSIQTSNKKYEEDGEELFDASDVEFIKKQGATKGGVLTN